MTKGNSLNATRIQNVSVTTCLTENCVECSGCYINKSTGFKLKCECSCHKEKIMAEEGDSNLTSNAVPVTTQVISCDRY